MMTDYSGDANRMAIQIHSFLYNHLPRKVQLLLSGTLRLSVVPDVSQFKWRNDEGLSDEMKRQYFYFNVYFDGVHVCGCDNFVAERKLLDTFYINMMALRKMGKIHWDPEEYGRIRKAKELITEQEDNALIDSLPTTTKEERIIKEGIKSYLKDDGKN